MSSLAAAAAAAAALSSECRDKSDQINKSNLLMLGSMENDEKVNKVNLKEYSKMFNCRVYVYRLIK